MNHHGILSEYQLQKIIRRLDTKLTNPLRADADFMSSGKSDRRKFQMFRCRDYPTEKALPGNTPCKTWCGVQGAYSTMKIIFARKQTLVDEEKEGAVV
jgi:hypothetical protein